ncbi:MAG: YaiO family outer membrane beta-barrel protein [Sulfuricurvum sp.]|nr:YaiO family outer membrane beta-barrel protein [Sulfuricurvum sp.]
MRNFNFSILFVLIIIPSSILAEISPNSSSNYSVENYDENIKNISNLISKNDFPQAIDRLQAMDKRYPENVEILELLASLQYWSHNYPEATSYYQILYNKTHNSFYLDKIDEISTASVNDQFTVKKNFVMLKGEAYSYGSNHNSEQDITFQAGIHALEMTWIGSTASIHRYALTDRQNGLEVYRNLGEKTSKRWGFISLYQSPNPYFLPLWDYSAGIYQGIFQDTEIGLVYRRMIFQNASIDIYKPSIAFPIPWNNTMRLTEELYLVPSSHSYANVSTLAYDPTEHLHLHYALTLGNGYEVTGADPLLHTRTFSQAIGGDWRFSPSWSIGIALTDGRRTNLYRRSGGEIFLKYFW